MTNKQVLRILFALSTEGIPYCAQRKRRINSPVKFSAIQQNSFGMRGFYRELDWRLTAFNRRLHGSRPAGTGPIANQR